MRILIEIDELTPPQGRLLAGLTDKDSGAPSPKGGEVPFAGWLGLLRALSTVVGLESADAPGRS